MEIRRGTLQGDPLSPLLFERMVEPLIRWLTATGKGYGIASCGLKLASKWYADDGILLTNSVEDMITLLDVIQQFSTWSGIHLNANRCKITAYIHALQAIPIKKGGAYLHRPRAPGPVEPGLLAGDDRCPPTSSWWALETPLTLARRGSGRRPSGGHGGGGCPIGGEIVQQPPSQVFF